MNTTELPVWIQSILAYRRKARVKFMLSKIEKTDSMRVIDIGCGIDGRSFDDYIPASWSITGIDVLLEDRVKHHHPKFTYIRQSAANLGCFKDQEFDLAVSVGMLEHITDPEVFNRVIAEIRRVASQYVVVVPYKYAWLEPHYGVPFFPLFPYNCQLFLIRLFNLSGHRQVVKNDPGYVKREYQWLSNNEYKKVFPDAKIFLMPTLETIAIVKAAKSIN